MTHKLKILAAASGIFLAVYFIFFNEKTGKAKENANVINQQPNTTTTQQPEEISTLDAYAAERRALEELPNLNVARHKLDLKNAPEYKVSSLRSKIAAGPVDDFGAPLFMPSEGALQNQQVFDSELARHKERSDAYEAARLDELKENTTVEKNMIKANIDRAKATKSKSPEEIQRAEEALARLEQLEKVLKGEKIEKMLE